MFGFLNGKKRAEAQAKKEYDRLLVAARDLQRAGKIQEFAKKTAEAEEARKAWEALVEASAEV